MVMMTPKIFDLLHIARRQSFVGRQNEISIFNSLAFSEHPSKVLLYVFGPGGQGKTTLLKYLVESCLEKKCRHIQLNGLELEAHPGAVLMALKNALQLPEHQNPVEYMGGLSEKMILFIDAYEKLNPLDDWFRVEFLPSMPSCVFTVICSRKVPSNNWLSDPGWKQLMECRQLRNFSPHESKSFLSRRGIPPEQMKPILDFTHGHPLALSLVADTMAQQTHKVFLPEETPDMMGTLLSAFLQEVPGPAHRTALEIAAMVNITTESVITEVMGLENASEIFGWLRQLSFMQINRDGMVPHEMIREALVYDLRWRHPDFYHELYEKIRKYYVNKLEIHHVGDQAKLLASLIYLHRLHPMVKPFFDWQESGGHWADMLQPDDIPVLTKMIVEQEGQDSLLVFEYWRQSPAAEILIWRDEDKSPAAFLLKIHLDSVMDQMHEPDQAVNKVIQYGKRHWGLRKGEKVVLFRMWMAKDCHQEVSPLQSSIFLNMVQSYFTPGLGISMVACANPGFWQMIFHYAAIYQLEELNFASGNYEFGWFLHDWRKQPVVDWLEMLGKRGAGESVEESMAKPLSDVLVLSEQAFEEAVSDALKNYAYRDGLKENPLLKSSLVVRKTGIGAHELERITCLQNQLQTCIKQIEESPLDGKYHRVLYRTYLNPVGSQEKTADFLNMSFSTYRRYLKAGTDKISERLWKEECNL